jgi:hypothetical protein
MDTTATPATAPRLISRKALRSIILDHLKTWQIARVNVPKGFVADVAARCLDVLRQTIASELARLDPDTSPEDIVRLHAMETQLLETITLNIHAVIQQRIVAEQETGFLSPEERTNRRRAALAAAATRVFNRRAKLTA